jgi:hypothetical protein
MRRKGWFRRAAGNPPTASSPVVEDIAGTRREGKTDATFWRCPDCGQELMVRSLRSGCHCNPERRARRITGDTEDDTAGGAFLFAWLVERGEFKLADEVAGQVFVRHENAGLLNRTVELLGDG